MDDADGERVSGANHNAFCASVESATAAERKTMVKNPSLGETNNWWLAKKATQSRGIDRKTAVRPPNESAEMYKWLCASQTIISADGCDRNARQHQSARVIYLNAAIFHRHSLSDCTRETLGTFSASRRRLRCALLLPGKKSKSAYHTQHQVRVSDEESEEKFRSRRVRNNFCINASSTLSVFFAGSLYICALVCV